MRVVFLDRDGVVNRYPGDLDYVKSWEEFDFLPQARSALKRLSDCGLRIFIISNQAGVSKGIFSQDKLNLITKNMLKDLSGRKISIAGVYYCTHRKEEQCFCRKPKTGLLDLAINKLKKEGFAIDLHNSYFVGDTIRDVETGKAAGLKTILVLSGKERLENNKVWQIHPDFVAQDLSQAADIILR